MLQGRLHNRDGASLCCNCLKGNDHFAQLRLDLHHHSSTLYPVQPRILGSRLITLDTNLFNRFININLGSARLH